MTTPHLHELVLAIGILCNFGAVVWWASKLSVKVDMSKDIMTRIEKDMDKRDTQMIALWTKVDKHSEMLASIEGRCTQYHKDKGSE